jgi:hypothetical protein
MEALGIQVSDTTVAAWIEDNFGNSGQSDAARTMYSAVTKELARMGLSESDLVRYIRHEVGIGHLVAVAGVSGSLVTPARPRCSIGARTSGEAESRGAGCLNYLSAVTLDPEKLAQFYTNRQATYRVPEKVRSSTCVSTSRTSTPRPRPRSPGAPTSRPNSTPCMFRPAPTASRTRTVRS